MSGIDDPCRCFLLVHVMPGMVLLDNADGGLLFSWKDILELPLIHLWDTFANDSRFFLGLL